MAKQEISNAAVVVAIDGPSGAGKGTVAMRIAKQFGFHLLDSGAIYRAAALHTLKNNVDLSNESAVVAAIASLDAVFKPNDQDGVAVLLNGQDVSLELRGQAAAEAASKIAVMPQVRQALLDFQRSFREAPGLVADGRDMGTIVFPDAVLKVFLTASAEKRAERRAKQLNEKGIQTTISGLLEEIVLRDKRDSTRQHAPLVAAEGAMTIDSSVMSIDEVVDQISVSLSSLC